MTSLWISSIKKRTKAGKLISRLPQKFRSKASDVADAIFDAQQAQGEVQLSNMGPFYHPGKRKVYNVATEPHVTVRLGDNFFTKGMRNMSDSPGIVGHELGHARIHKAIGKAYVPITMAARKIGLLPMIGGMAGYYGYRNKDEKKAKAFALSGLGLSGLAGATVMADEATASLIGRKMLKGVTKDKSIINNSTKRLLSATGTYGAKYVLPVVAGGAIYAIDRKKRAKARAAEEAPTKTAGSDITFRSGEDKYTPSRGYHYAAQGRYAYPFMSGKMPKYVRATTPYPDEPESQEYHVKPRHMEKFIKDYNRDAVTANEYKDMPDLSMDDPAIDREHQATLDFLRRNAKKGITYHIG